MVSPLLKLEFTQGPRAGDSLNFKPGSTVRIGRIVRGNDIAVKDAGISTKHLQIVSDSENWIIHELGSSNGTILNSETLDPDTPVNLRHGDIIKLGEYTTLVVNFVTDVEAQELKLPPRPRRNNKRLAVSDPDPDPIEPVQDKPTRKGRSSKQDEHELPKRTRASRQRSLKDVVDKDKELEVENDNKIKTRVGRPRKQQSSGITKEEEVTEEENENKIKVRVGRPRKQQSSGITKEEEITEEENENKIKAGVGRPRKQQSSGITKGEEVTEEENRNSRVQRSMKNTESVQTLDLNAVKLEVEDTPKGVEISDRKRATRNKQIGNACLGLENVKSAATVLEEKNEKRTSRTTRSKKTEIGGDSFLELEMVLNQARKSRAKRKKMELEPSKSVVDMEAKKDDYAGEEALKNRHIEEDKRNEAQESCSQRSDDKCDEKEGDGSKRAEQVEIDLGKKSTLGEDDLGCTVREDGETESLKDLGLVQEECCNTIECKSEGVGIAASGDGCGEEKVEQGSSNKNVEKVEVVDLGKMTVEEWFDYMDVQRPKEIIEETEKLIEPMRSKTLRVHKHIAEQREKGL